ncbi:hypothetical protein BC826DRAFT_200777 [Russula brevipes]|nr:hypothetical protein BC826DRAFT_200777 [Russula brevipes]
MTPTRTDTTLRQRRRALERISLNNPHSHLHSDVTRSLVGSGACSTAARVSNEQGSSRMHENPGHTREQLVNWVMSKDAVASCFIKDVLSMSESEHGGLPYYFLGRVPCRSISLVAIVVGAAAYERRVVYTLDDGTGTIECAFRSEEGKPESKASENKVVTSLARHPSPLVQVGSVAKVQGKVRAKHNSREISGDSIERCKGLREELEHWQRVTSLHKDYYFLPDPFVIPSSSGITDIGTRDAPQTPKSTKAINSTVSTPSTHSSTLSSATSSPVKSSEDPSLLPRLRHPSRLRSRDLTENTFRIYVKHFMDNLCYLKFGPQPREDDGDSDTDSIAAAIDKTPVTPTKKRPAPDADDDNTPRLSRRTSALATPRARLPPRPRPPSRPDHGEQSDEKDAVVGCTLSFLLRVPELATLASRVVQAEAHRREKTRTRTRTKAEQSDQADAATSPDPARTTTTRRTLASSAEGAVPKIKRLFFWAIHKLYQDGSIILWDGPALSVLEPHAKTPLLLLLDSSVLYRSSQPVAVDDDAGRSTSTSPRTASRRRGAQNAQPVECITEDLSDPPSDEEAYASLSTAYLATQVERAIRSLTALQTRRKGEAESTFLGPAISRRRHLPLPGPTQEDITTHLKRGDDRWKRVNGWAVQEALEWLRDNGRVWCVSEDGGGRWELCS